jgi:hypothetical protein
MALESDFYGFAVTKNIPVLHCTMPQNACTALQIYRERLSDLQVRYAWCRVADNHLPARQM